MPALLRPCVFTLCALPRRPSLPPPPPPPPTTPPPPAGSLAPQNISNMLHGFTNLGMAPAVGAGG